MLLWAFRISVFFPVCISGSGILNFLRSLHTVFHSGCTNLHFPQPSMKVPLSLHPCQHLLLVSFWMTVILTGLRWYLVVLISLMISDVKHLFMCISLGKNVFSSFAQFLIGILFMLSCMSCLHMLDINPLTAISSANIFSHSVGCLFALLTVSFAVLKFNWVVFVYFCFYFLCFRRQIQRKILWVMSKNVLPMFSSAIYSIQSYI